ncbi:hypothetical protein OXX69_001983 [Metschnikowia pulcherrima]
MLVPVEGTETPVEGTETPVEGTETPVEGTETPVEGTETPVEGTETLDNASSKDCVEVSEPLEIARLDTLGLAEVPAPDSAEIVGCAKSKVPGPLWELEIIELTGMSFSEEPSARAEADSNLEEAPARDETIPVWIAAESDELSEVSEALADASELATDDETLAAIEVAMLDETGTSDVSAEGNDADREADKPGEDSSQISKAHDAMLETEDPFPLADPDRVVSEATEISGTTVEAILLVTADVPSMSVALPEVTDESIVSEIDEGVEAIFDETDVEVAEAENETSFVKVDGTDNGNSADESKAELLIEPKLVEDVRSEGTEMVRPGEVDSKETVAEDWSTAEDVSAEATVEEVMLTDTKGAEDPEIIEGRSTMASLDLVRTATTDEIGQLMTLVAPEEASTEEVNSLSRLELVKPVTDEDEGTKEEAAMS